MRNRYRFLALLLAMNILLGCNVSNQEKLTLEIIESITKSEVMEEDSVLILNKVDNIGKNLLQDFLNNEKKKELYSIAHHLLTESSIDTTKEIKLIVNQFLNQSKIVINTNDALPTICISDFVTLENQNIGCYFAVHNGIGKSAGGFFYSENGNIKYQPLWEPR